MSEVISRFSLSDGILYGIICCDNGKLMLFNVFFWCIKVILKNKCGKFLYLSNACVHYSKKTNVMYAEQFMLFVHDWNKQ